MQSGRQSHVNLKSKEVLFYELRHFQLMIDFERKIATEPCCPVRRTDGRCCSFGIFLEFICLEHIDWMLCPTHTHTVPSASRKKGTYVFLKYDS